MVKNVELHKLCDLAVKLGAEDAKVMEADKVVVSHWTRWKCRFGCGVYGKSLICPPFSPTPEKTKALLNEYEYALVFRHKPVTLQLYQTILRLEREMFLLGYYSALGFGVGDYCPHCKPCPGLKNGVCVKPQLARTSMEGCGIDVFATARNAGYDLQVLTSREQECWYFGMILFNESTRSLALLDAKAH